MNPFNTPEVRARLEAEIGRKLTDDEWHFAYEELEKRFFEKLDRAILHGIEEQIKEVIH